jgi:uncharacterized protein
LTLSLHEASAPLFRQGLTALAAILDKSAAQCADRKIDPAVLLASRLAPDMFPLTRQVQLSCDFAKNTMSRLAGREPPKFPDEEATVPELQERIARTLDLVATIPAAEIDGQEGRTITLNIGGQSMSFQGQPYLLNFALPNFFFHLTTAYLILRHNGVQIGKRDFIGAIPGM